MPYVNIKVPREGATGLLVEVLGKNPETVLVVNDEVDTDNTHAHL